MKISLSNLSTVLLIVVGYLCTSCKLIEIERVRKDNEIDTIVARIKNLNHELQDLRKNGVTKSDRAGGAGGNGGPGGINGEPGKNGKPGKSGKTGKNGKAGKPGAPGKRSIPEQPGEAKQNLERKRNEMPKNSGGNGKLGRLVKNVNVTTNTKFKNKEKSGKPSSRKISDGSGVPAGKGKSG